MQHDLGHGLIADVSYVGNARRHGYGRRNDVNAVPPFTVWNPKDGLVAAYKDPTGSGFYSTNLVRALTGYAGYGAINIWTYVDVSSYNSLQMQLNRRTGALQWNVNYTWSKTLIYDYDQWVERSLLRRETNRRHAVNFNFGYSLPKPSQWVNNIVVKQALDGWKLNGNGAIYSGNPFTVTCGQTGAPAGYWTGTPTGGIPFRCQMGDNPFLPAGQLPTPTDDPRLQPFALNAANFTLPGIDSWGIGNTPPVMFFGPGAINLDLSLAKFFKITESKNLEIRAETFNTLNHMNPNNPSSGITRNFNTGAITSANFGLVTGSQVGSRRMILSARFRF